MIKLYGNTVVKNIKLTALGEGVKIAGAGHIDIASNGDLSFGMNGSAVNEVTLDCSQYNNGEGVALSAYKENPTEFWFALPPVTMTGGMKITVTQMNGEVFEKQTTNDVVIKRSKIQPMEALEHLVYQFRYTTNDQKPLEFNGETPPFNATIVKHTYVEGEGGVITFDEPLTQINKKAFYSQKTLTGITIPGSVTDIHNEAFHLCISLETVVFEPSPTATPLTFHYGITGLFGQAPFFDSPLTTVKLNRELIIRMSSGNINEPESSYGSTNGLFASRKIDGNSEKTTLTSVTLGEQVKTIGGNMFKGAQFTSFVIPGSVTKISGNAFAHCDKLSSLTFEEGTEQLQIELMSGVFYEWGPFYDSPLSNIILNRDIVPTAKFSSNQHQWEDGIFANKHYDDLSSVNISLGNRLKTISKYMFSKMPFTSITIPSSVTTIEADAFHGCEALTTLTFESGTTDLKIGPSTEGSNEYGPFYDSQNLTTLSLDRNLVATYTINHDEEGFFSKIESLKNITLGPNVKTIHNRMFLETGIEKITIPGNVTKIDKYAFYNCESLNSITFESGDKNLAIVANPSPYKGPFYYSPLRNISLDREVKHFDDDGDAYEADDWQYGIFSYEFYDEEDVSTTLTIGNKVKTILPYMFTCLRIRSVELPASVTSIGNSAFYYCTQLGTFKLHGTNPPSLGDDVFEDCDDLDYIQVPSSSKNAYLNSDWGDLDQTITGW